uniref:Uncharacterized protein n=1 Tax=Strigamia maritima TaxID=126957 RepID=T1J2Z0_STRMM
MAASEDPQFDRESSCHLLNCGTNNSHLLQLELGQAWNLSTRNLIWQPRHNYSMSHDMLKILMNSCKIVIPSEIKDEMKKGVSVWDLALAYHYKHNAHHNYSTTDDQVAQEIALDFFSSALVSCPLTGEYITRGRVKRAANGIKTWPNYVKSTKQVKDAVLLVEKVLFEDYLVEAGTVEEEIPSKPYNYEESKNRHISPGLLETFKSVFGCSSLGDEHVLESDLMIKLLHYFGYCVDNDVAGQTWMYALFVLFTNSELGKWVVEVYNHKMLVEDFHKMVVNRQIDNYVVSDEIASSHDNDKYIPFQLIAYTLKWYYNNTGVFE